MRPARRFVATERRFRPAVTPEPPYYAVIFTSLRTEGDEGYGDMAALMERLAAKQPGFLGMESARDKLGVTISYWRDTAAITAWRNDADHQVAQQLGLERWYASDKVRIARVEREYSFEAR